VLVLLATTVVGLVWRARQGQFRDVRSGGMGRPGPSGGTGRAGGKHEPSETLLSTLAQLGETPGERATLLQFSSAFCAPCRATRSILADVAKAIPGVRHVEVDAESHLDVVRSLNILKTPTTLVLDKDGRVAQRASGQPRKEHILAALEKAVG
jgi:thiol-disulfide isomerase/thioredoxin